MVFAPNHFLGDKATTVNNNRKEESEREKLKHIVGGVVASVSGKMR